MAKGWTACIVGLIVAVLGLMVWSELAYGTDYGACLRSHQEPRHRDAWVEIQQHYCGKDCYMTMPVYHPAEDWIAVVCDEYQYPEGCGPRAGYKRKAECR